MEKIIRSTDSLSVHCRKNLEGLHVSLRSETKKPEPIYQSQIHNIIFLMAWWFNLLQKLTLEYFIVKKKNQDYVRHHNAVTHC